VLDKEKGAKFTTYSGISDGIRTFIKKGLENHCYDAVLVLARLPESNSATYLLAEDTSRLERIHISPSVMIMQGAGVISDMTRQGKTNKTIAVLLRPCEIRATAELYKRNQINLDNLILIGVDCLGVSSLSEWVTDPIKIEEKFINQTDVDHEVYIRPICQICQHFSMTEVEDLHIGTITDDEDLLLIPGSLKGIDILNQLALPIDQDITDWEMSIDRLAKVRYQNRQKMFDKLRLKNTTKDNLLTLFNNCINCYNCMRVCPICYCRQCLFESNITKLPFDHYLTRAELTGALELPPDIALFHTGRMSHMAVSCVSCGACEDVCPMSIPVAQVFAMIGEVLQKESDYVPGRSLYEPLPLLTYLEKDSVDEVCSSGANNA
jgi:formate dehydrogenase subunit beta